MQDVDQFARIVVEAGADFAQFGYPLVGQADAMVFVVRVQQLVSQRAARFSQIVFVEGDDVGVFVAFAAGFLGISAVEGRGTAMNHFGISVVERLPAAADTSARTSHYFDSMEGGGAVFHFFHQFAGVCQAVGDADFHGYAVEVYRGTLDTFQAAQFFEVHVVKRLFGVQLVSRAAGCFHHAASSAEDDGGTGGFAQRLVVLAFRQVDEVNVGVADEAG
ncbi:hypothetical protein Barb7_02976 [Bacteroidales bacterium Barb7]|nr:hypothetical protein Barb7_02976 [Bacteroidales bacterium Barb7]